MHILKKIIKSEEGATAIEYALIASIISVVIIGALKLIGPELTSSYKEIGTSLQTNLNNS